MKVEPLIKPSKGAKGRYKSITRIIMMRLTLGISSVASNYLLYIFNGALPTLKVMTDIKGHDHEGYYEGLLVSGFSVGALVGCFIASLIVNKPRSSRNIVRIMDLMSLIAVYLSCLTIIWTIVVGRFLFGVVAGLTGVIIPLYAKEITPVEVYGMMGGFDKLL